MALDGIKALTFDVFGTVVDWRSSVAREINAVAKRKGWTVDGAAVADAWRGLYRPSMDQVARRERPWVNLDVLHRESLEKVLAQFGLRGLDAAELDDLNRAWHRLDPWPDVVAGLTRLKTKFILATLSNGNVSLMVNMAKRAGLPWDAILGAETARHYKPEPETYLSTAAYLDLKPEQCMMVAAHNGDLINASRLGFRTAFVPRPDEHGPGQNRDIKPQAAFEAIATDFLDLARRLDC